MEQLPRSNKGPCLRSAKLSLSDHIFMLIGIIVCCGCGRYIRFWKTPFPYSLFVLMTLLIFMNHPD